MAIIIDEKKMIDDAKFKFEERAKSPLSRFLDKNFIPVNYHHINNNETTTDGGWQDVEDFLGDRSPIKFQLIKGLPIYGIETIIVQLQDSDQGLDGTFEGEGVILPGTIVPSQNDYFTIPSLKDDYIFRITEVSYDSIMPDNFYRINYMLSYIDHEKKENLISQSTEKYTCVIENIGTEDRCLIEDEYYEEIQRINNIYDEMTKTYLTFFYDDKHNCLLGDFYNGKRIYDPLQTEFINKHSLFNKKNDLTTIILTDQFEDNRRKVKYEKSIYRCIERKDYKRINQYPYITFPGTNNTETSFYHWVDRNVVILDVVKNIDQEMHYNMISEEFLDTITYNGPTDSSYANIIKKYIRDDSSLDFSDITTALVDELINLDDANLEMFFYTPIVLYIIKDIVNTFIKRKDEES